MRSQMRCLRLVVRALYELARYDVASTLRKGSIERQLAVSVANRAPRMDDARAVCDAFVLARCFYWKPVLCLQRSVCLVRVLRAQGIAARLVVGYRPMPFVSHAWVEVDGRVVSDSSAYRQRLHVLLTA